MSDRTEAAKISVMIGTRAPDFTLPDQTGQPVTLSTVVGKTAIVLYFYPKDNTPGCTTEACTFRDSYEAFKEAGAEVIGISADSVASHQGFIAKNRLPFILLSDVEDTVRTLYGVSRTMGIFPGRVTYVIDQKGIVRHVFSSQLAPAKHVSEALTIIESLHKSLALSMQQD